MPPAGLAVPPLVREERGREMNKWGIFGGNGIRSVELEREMADRCGNLPRLLVYRPWVWSVRVSCSSSSSAEKYEGGLKGGRLKE